MDFAKKVAVPAVSNLRELSRVLDESRVFNSNDVDAAINEIHGLTGSDSVGVGIKTVLDCIFEAKAGGPDSNMVETFTELLAEKIHELRG